MLFFENMVQLAEGVCFWQINCCVDWEKSPVDWNIVLLTENKGSWLKPRLTFHYFSRLTETPCYFSLFFKRRTRRWKKHPEVIFAVDWNPVLFFTIFEENPEVAKEPGSGKKKRYGCQKKPLFKFGRELLESRLIFHYFYLWLKPRFIFRGWLKPRLIFDGCLKPRLIFIKQCSWLKICIFYSKFEFLTESVVQLAEVLYG